MSALSKRRVRRIGATAVLSASLLVLLTGCIGAFLPEPGPPQLPESATLLGSEAEAMRAMRDLVDRAGEAFIAAVNERDVALLDADHAGHARTETIKTVRNYIDEEFSITGEMVNLNFTLHELRDNGWAATVTVSYCIDATQMWVIEADGSKMKPEGHGYVAVIATGRFSEEEARITESSAVAAGPDCAD